MRAFIGILLLSEYSAVPRRRLYWAAESDTYNKRVATTMRRNRFEEIMRFSHGANNANLLIEDKLTKVRPFLNILNRNFLASGHAFGPTVASIDESMIPYYGRHPIKLLICGKLIRWEFKGCVAASPLGCAVATDLYQGKHRPENRTDRRNQFGLGDEIVLDFLDNLEAQYGGRRISLYFDNFFTSIKLLEHIQERGHGATGTVRCNCLEKCPLANSKVFSKLPRGREERFLEKNAKIFVVRWKDNGLVCMASNEHGLRPLKKVDCYSATKKKIAGSMPNVICMYNRHMGGVDRVDENISLYRIAIPGKKWYFPLFCYLLNVCVNNASLFARAGDYSDDMLAFTCSIVQC